MASEGCVKTSRRLEHVSGETENSPACKQAISDVKRELNDNRETLGSNPHCFLNTRKAPRGGVGLRLGPSCQPSLDSPVSSEKET